MWRPPRSTDRGIARSPEGSSRLDPQPLEAWCRHTGGLWHASGNESERSLVSDADLGIPKVRPCVAWNRVGKANANRFCSRRKQSRR